MCMVANNEELEINQYISIIEQKTMLFDLLSKLFLLAYHQNLHKARTTRTRQYQNYYNKYEQKINNISIQ